MRVTITYVPNKVLIERVSDGAVWVRSSVELRSRSEMMIILMLCDVEREFRNAIVDRIITHLDS